VHASLRRQTKCIQVARYDWVTLKARTEPLYRHSHREAGHLANSAFAYYRERFSRSARCAVDLCVRGGRRAVHRRGRAIGGSVLLALAFFGSSVCACAGPTDDALCQQAVAASEKSAQLPAKMLSAISVVESGRPSPTKNGTIAWPWTINIAGAGYFFESKGDAIAAVQAAQHAGVQSIDVGCTQINLLHHPQAFANLDEAFDPVANTQYAAKFLLQLHEKTNSWAATVAAYHSFTPALGAAYAQQVAMIWPLAASFGLLQTQSHDGHSLGLSVLDSDVDPYHVMTKEFRAQIIRQAAYQRVRDRSMGVIHPSPSILTLTYRSHLTRSNRALRGQVEARN
jgi:hypothetical protein